MWANWGRDARGCGRNGDVPLLILLKAGRKGDGDLNDDGCQQGDQQSRNPSAANRVRQNVCVSLHVTPPACKKRSKVRVVYHTIRDKLGLCTGSRAFLTLCPAPDGCLFIAQHLGDADVRSPQAGMMLASVEMIRTAASMTTKADGAMTKSTRITSLLITWMNTYASGSPSTPPAARRCRPGQPFDPEDPRHRERSLLPSRATGRSRAAVPAPRPSARLPAPGCPPPRRSAPRCRAGHRRSNQFCWRYWTTCCLVSTTSPPYCTPFASIDQVIDLPGEGIHGAGRVVPRLNQTAPASNRRGRRTID